MAKIGIREIKIVHHENVPAVFFDKSGLHPIPYVDFLNIRFVQDTAVLTDEEVEDDNGVYHNINLTFSIRADFDFERWNLKKYKSRPLVILVETVDGKNYCIGSHKMPAYITTNTNYNKIDTREIVVTCSYKNINGLIDMEI